MSTNYLAQFSANLSTISAVNINYSTLVGSTIIASSIISNSTINVSSITSRAINYSTLSGSTLIAQMVNYSTLAGSTLNSNTMTINSTLTGSTLTTQNVNYSTLTGSTMAANTMTINSSINVSTITARAINYSTLTGSTMTINTLVIASTLTVSTLIATNNPAGVITSSMISLGASTNQSYTALAQGNFSTSTNWLSTLTNLVSTKTVTMSGNAQTQLAISQVSTISSVYYTSTLGTSWSTISNVTGLPTATQTNYTCGAVSGNGQYAALGVNGGYLYVTSTLTSATGPSFANTNPNIPAIYTYLPFEGNTNDASGNNRNATVTGSVTYVTGIVGKNAVNIVNTTNGTAASNYIRGALSGVTNFSVSCWFNLQSYSNTEQIIFSCGGTGYDVYIKTIANGNVLAANHQPTNTQLGATSYAIALYTWYNFTYIFQAGGTSYFYVNNVLIASATSPSTGLTTINGFGLGCHDSATGFAFNGYIDDLKIYNTAITFTPMVPANWSNVALSNSGQYMLATVANGGLFMSSNYGSTWSQVTSVSGSASWQGLAISAKGQYMVAVSQTTNNAPVYSTDFGSNWTQSTFLGNAGSFIAMSGSGQYCITGYTNTALLVANYLAGFSTTTYLQPIFSLANSNNITGAAISQTGQYMVIVTNATSGNNVYYSNNYGGNFTGLLIGTTPMTSCAISYDGVYITVSNATTVYQLNNNSIGFSVSVGNQAGQQTQGQNAIAIGNQAGQQNQGQNAIAIGNQAGQINQSGNSIILNATGSALNSYYSGLYASPIATYSAVNSQSMALLGYGTDNQIVQSGVTFGTGTQVIYGEWIQYQLVTPVQISSYMLQQRQPGGPFAYRLPVAWTVVGSVDGINWVILDTRSGGTSSLWGTTYTLNATSAFYSYFRIIITQINSTLVGTGQFAGYYVDIGGFVLYNNGVSIFGAYTNYTYSGAVNNVVNNVVLLNSIPVCTVTLSMSSATTNALGITYGGSPNLGYIITSNGASYPTWPYASFYMYGPLLGAGEYSTSFTAVQGTATPVTIQPLIQVKDLSGNTQFQSTIQYPLDVNGIVRTQQLQFQDGTMQSTASNNQYIWSQAGLNWTKTSCPAANWYRCALNYSGQYQIAAAVGGQLYVSADYGSTWTSITTSNGLSSNSLGWTWCSISSTGQYMAVGYASVGTVGGIYLSSNYGQTWNYIQASNYYAQFVPMSASGQYMMIVAGYSGSTVSGYIYVSSNYGQTWTQTTQYFSGTGGSGAAISGTGQYMSYTYNNVAYLSSTYGQSWSTLSLASASGVAISYSGQYIVIGYGSLGVYVSSNYGVSFSTNTTPVAQFYISMSFSGQYVFINRYSNGTIYLSTNYGATFSIVTTTNFADMYASGISGSGQYQMAVCTTSGFVYTSATPIYTPGLLTVGATVAPVASSAGTTNLSVYGNITFNRNRLIFSTSNDWNHCIYNNFFNMDSESSWDGMKFNVYAGAWFRVGNASGATPTTAMFIDSVGKVGIGTTSLSFSSLNPKFSIYNTTGNETMHIYSSSPSSTNFIRMQSTITVGAGGNLFFVGFYNNGAQLGSIVGNGSGSVAYNTTSDGRQKKNINYNFNGINIINQLKPASFSMLTDVYNTVYHGFIAQDVHPIYPQYVSTSIDGIYSMDYKQFIGIIVKAIQEQQTTIQQQATEITALQSTLAAQSTQLSTQESQIAQLISRLAAAGIA